MKLIKWSSLSVHMTYTNNMYGMVSIADTKCNSRFIHWYHVTFDTWPTVSLLKLTLFRWCGCRPRLRYVDLLTLTDLVTVQVLARLHGHSITCAHRTTYTRRSPVMAPFVPEIYDLVTWWPWPRHSNVTVSYILQCTVCVWIVTFCATL